MTIPKWIPLAILAVPIILAAASLIGVWIRRGHGHDPDDCFEARARRSGAA